MDEFQGLVFEHLDLSFRRYPGKYFLLNKAWLAKSMETIGPQTILHRVLSPTLYVEVTLFVVQEEVGMYDDSDIKCIEMDLCVGCVEKFGKLYNFEADVFHDSLESTILIDTSKEPDVFARSEDLVKIKSLALSLNFSLVFWFKTYTEVRHFADVFKMKDPSVDIRRTKCKVWDDNIECRSPPNFSFD